MYPPGLLALPLTIQERLPAGLQSVDIQVALVTHCFLALCASLFTIHPSYLLPISLFGLAATHPDLTSLLPHFLAMWIITVPLDFLWLLYKGPDARFVVVAAVAASLALKFPSAGAVAHTIRAEGYLQHDGSGLLGNRSGSVPGGLWTGTGDVPGSYNSVYADEDEEAAMAPDAQHVQIPSNAAGAGRQGGSNGSAAQTNTPSKPGKGGYSSIE